MQSVENVQANFQEGYCFIMTMTQPIQPEEPKREFNNYNGNSSNIRLTTRTWPLVTSVCSSKDHLGGKHFTDDEEAEMRCGSGREHTQKASMLRIPTHWLSDGTSVSMLVEDMSRNKCFSQVRISRYMFHIHLWPNYWLFLVHINTNAQTALFMMHQATSFLASFFLIMAHI
jgi:hypothetical protein